MADPGRDRRLTPTAATLAVLFLADVGVTGQGFFSLAVAAVGFLSLLVRAARSAFRGERETARARTLRSVLYLALGVLTIGVLRVHRVIAATRAEGLIQACRAYQEKHAQLPESLQQLVPEFLPAIPRARYAAMYADFSYWVTRDDSTHHLMYVVVPPYGRRTYTFETGVWDTLD